MKNKHIFKNATCSAVALSLMVTTAPAVSFASSLESNTMQEQENSAEEILNLAEIFPDKILRASVQEAISNLSLQDPLEP